MFKCGQFSRQKIFLCEALSIIKKVYSMENKVYYSLAVLLFYYKQVNKGLIFLVVIF